MIFAAAYVALAILTAFWLRHRIAFFQRLNDMHWQAAVVFDIVGVFPLFWLPFVFGILRERPLPWATISAICGCYALQGKRWAIVASWAIDAVFFVLTSQRRHCAKAFAKWASPLGPIEIAASA